MVLEGMVEMHARQHRERVEAAAKISNEALVPPVIRKQLDRTMHMALAYPLVEQMGTTNKYLEGDG